MKDGDEALALILKVHLALEALLIEALHLNADATVPIPRSFPDKTKKLVEKQLLRSDDEAAFNRFNEFRNDIAHTFGHIVTVKTVLELARYLEDHGIDFSDSIGFVSEEVADNEYDGVIGVLAEIGWCLLFHAGMRLSDAGGRDIFSA
jgi:uncharacterized protein YutE (UPF0331/DUF86 family)